MIWTWALGSFSVLGMWLTGRHRYGWLVSLVAELCWIPYIVWTRQHGILLQTAAHSATYVRNWLVARNS